MLKSYKYRIYPTENQQNQMSQIFGSCRFVYNLALETKISAYAGNKVNLTCFDLCKQVTDLKKDLIWLNDCPAQALQMQLNNLDNAYTKFFKGCGFPKFKNKHGKQTFQLPQYVSINYDTNKIFLPKLKNVDIIIDRKFEGIIKTVTVSKTITNKYFVSILVDNQKSNPIKPLINESTSVGIDLGIKDLMILSDGTKFSNPKYTKKLEKRLRIEQRSLQRKYKKNIKIEEQSNSFKKQKLKVALIHEKIKNQRIDNINKVTTSIVKKYDTIILEDLDVKGLISINDKEMCKLIHDASWFEIRRQFTYKSEWYGKNLLFIGRFDPSSKTCSNCGTIKRDLKLDDRTWICSKCNTEHDRDVNAAINIKTFGLRNKI